MVDHPGDETRKAAAPAHRTNERFFLTCLHDQTLKRTPALAALVFINGHDVFPLSKKIRRQDIRDI
jgi:hypothetical protein